MSNNQLANSQSSQIQSLKPNNLLNFITTPEEYAIAISVQTSPLIRDLKDPKPLLALVAKWRAYIGLPKDDVSEELAILVKYLKDNWGMLTLAEIELSINLSINRKLDDCEFYGFFSPMYVSKVLGAYMYYRKVTMADSIRKKEKFEMEEQEKKNKPTPEQEALLTQEITLGFYKEFLKTGEVNDPFNLTYNFLRKHKWLIVTQDDIDKAMANGKSKYQEVRQKDAMLRAMSDNPETEIKRHARNFFVANYFKNVDIDILINNIKPELFLNLEEKI